MRNNKLRIWSAFLLTIGLAIPLLVWSIQSLTQVPACGDQLDSAIHRGVIARSNAEDMGSGDSCGGRGFYGLQYQCVEYIKRFYGVAFGVESELWRGNAVDYYSNAEKYGFVKYKNGESNIPPSPDDILVFSSPTSVYGHVAIVTAVSSNTVSIIEQNWSRTGTANLGLSYNNGTYTISRRGTYGVLGWLRRPQIGWLSFKEGNPGIPGDGVFINAADAGWYTTFELILPIKLSEFNDGFTVTIFFPPDVQIQGLGFNITFENINSWPSPCWRAGSFATSTWQTILINGVKGFVVNFPQSWILDWIAFQAQSLPACNLKIEDFFIVALELYPVPYNHTYFSTLDAVSILPGQNAFPSAIKMP